MGDRGSYAARQHSNAVPHIANKKPPKRHRFCAITQDRLPPLSSGTRNALCPSDQLLASPHKRLMRKISHHYRAKLSSPMRGEHDKQRRPSYKNQGNIMFGRNDIALRHLKFAMDEASVGILCVDKNGSFKYVNPKACELFGYTKRDFSSKSFFDLFSYYTPATWFHYWNLVKHKHRITYEYPVLKKKGSNAVYEFQCVFFSLDGHEGVYAFVRDVTDRVMAQHELETKAHKLRASQEELRRLSMQVLHAQDRERRRLARELHDDLGQSLALLKVRIDALARKIGLTHTVLYHECKATGEQVERIIESIRRLSRDLSTGFLEDLGLTASLRILLQEFGRVGDIRTTHVLTTIDHMLPLDAQINLYRFCQEVLNNIHKHAHARNVSMRLTCRAGMATLRIRDDGIGFHVEQIGQDTKRRGMGLTTIKERAAMLNGCCTIQSKPGSGTCVSLQFPVGGEST
ncbi:MAG: PAS domain S-box protein [Desulfobacterota bacterium]|nr:PAS domain S-box protein [Thermodesulfobacteriota bacterium]